jgi:hypothetical protein
MLADRRLPSMSAAGDNRKITSNYRTRFTISSIASVVRTPSVTTMSYGNGYGLPRSDRNNSTRISPSRTITTV